MSMLLHNGSGAGAFITSELVDVKANSIHSDCQGTCHSPPFKSKRWRCRKYQACLFYHVAQLKYDISITHSFPQKRASQQYKW
jgi:hypothetical protein